jgi:hypothetical protein
MSKPRYILIVLVLLVVGYFAGRHFLVSEKTRVRRRFDALAEAVSRGPSESTSRLLLKMRTLEGLFADPCAFEVQRFRLTTTMSPREIASEATRARQMFQRISVHFHDITIIAMDAENAEVTCTVRAAVERNGEIERDTAEINCTLKKIEGKWRFAEMAEQVVLER